MNSPDLNTVQAVVRGRVGDQAEVEVAQGCGRCHEKGGCGGQSLTRMFACGPARYQVDNTFGAEVGEQVIVAVPAGSLRRSAHLAYVLPVLLLVTGAGLGTAVGGDVTAIIGGGFGLLAAVGYLIRRSRQGLGNTLVHPHIVSRSSTCKEACRS